MCLEGCPEPRASAACDHPLPPADDPRARFAPEACLRERLDNGSWACQGTACEGCEHSAGDLIHDLVCVEEGEGRRPLRRGALDEESFDLRVIDVLEEGGRMRGRPLPTKKTPPPLPTRRRERRQTREARMTHPIDPSKRDAVTSPATYEPVTVLFHRWHAMDAAPITVTPATAAEAAGLALRAASGTPITLDYQTVRGAAARGVLTRLAEAGAAIVLGEVVEGDGIHGQAARAEFGDGSALSLMVWSGKRDSVDFDIASSNPATPFDWTHDHPSDANRSIRLAVQAGEEDAGREAWTPELDEERLEKDGRGLICEFGPSAEGKT